MADVVLPATMFMEHDDIYQGGGHQYILLGPKLIEPPGECRNNHEVIVRARAAPRRRHDGFAMTPRELIDWLLPNSGWGRSPTSRSGTGSTASPISTPRTTRRASPGRTANSASSRTGPRAVPLALADGTGRHNAGAARPLGAAPRTAPAGPTGRPRRRTCSAPSDLSTCSAVAGPTTPSTARANALASGRAARGAGSARRRARPRAGGARSARYSASRRVTTGRNRPFGRVLDPRREPVAVDVERARPAASAVAAASSTSSTFTATSTTGPLGDERAAAAVEDRAARRARRPRCRAASSSVSRGWIVCRLTSAPPRRRRARSSSTARRVGERADLGHRPRRAPARGRAVVALGHLADLRAASFAPSRPLREAASAVSAASGVVGHRARRRGRRPLPGGGVGGRRAPRRSRPERVERDERDARRAEHRGGEQPDDDVPRRAVGCRLAAGRACRAPPRPPSEGAA